MVILKLSLRNIDFFCIIMVSIMIKINGFHECVHVPKIFFLDVGFALVLKKALGNPLKWTNLSKQGD